MARAARQQSDDMFRATKLATAEFFATRMLSQVPALLGNVRQPAESLMALSADHF